MRNDIKPLLPWLLPPSIVFACNSLQPIAYAVNESRFLRDAGVWYISVICTNGRIYAND